MEEGILPSSSSSSLNEDCLIHILSLLDCTTLPYLARVNKTFNRIINHSPILWHHIILNGTLTNLTHFILNYLLKHHHHHHQQQQHHHHQRPLQTIHVKFLQLSKISYNDKPGDQSLKISSNHNNNNNNNNNNDDDDDGHHELLPFLNSLDGLLQSIGSSLIGVRLDEEAYELLNNNNYMLVLIESLGTWCCASTLKKLELYCSETSDLLDNTTMLYLVLLLPNLTEITYRHPWGMSIDSVTHLSELKLTRLNLITQYMETSIFNTILCQNLPHLTHLGISCFSNSTHSDENWAQVLNGLCQLKELQVLQLDWSNSVNKDGLNVFQFNELLNSCKALKWLIYKVSVEAYIDEKDIELDSPYKYGFYASWTSGDSQSATESIITRHSSFGLDRWHRIEMIRILDGIKDLFEKKKIKLTIHYEIE